MLMSIKVLVVAVHSSHVISVYERKEREGMSYGKKWKKGTVFELFPLTLRSKVSLSVMVETVGLARNEVTE